MKFLKVFILILNGSKNHCTLSVRQRGEIVLPIEPVHRRTQFRMSDALSFTQNLLTSTEWRCRRKGDTIFFLSTRFHGAVRRTRCQKWSSTRFPPIDGADTKTTRGSARGVARWGVGTDRGHGTCKPLWGRLKTDNGCPTVQLCYWYIAYTCAAKLLLEITLNNFASVTVWTLGKKLIKALLISLIALLQIKGQRIISTDTNYPSQ